MGDAGCREGEVLVSGGGGCAVPFLSQKRRLKRICPGFSSEMKINGPLVVWSPNVYFYFLWGLRQNKGPVVTIYYDSESHRLLVV